MRNAFHNSELPKNQCHPNEEQLLWFLDRELPPKEASALREHIETCWSCSAALSKLQETIATFVQYRDCVLSVEATPPPRGWHTFETQAAEVAQCVSRPSLRSRLLAAASRASLALDAARRQHTLVPVISTAVLVLLVALGLIYSSRRVSEISATGLLSKAATNEREMHAGAGKTFSRTILLEEQNPASAKKVSRKRIELWFDAGTKAEARRVFDDDNHLIAGEWVKSDGTRTIYDKRGLRPAPASSASEKLAGSSAWQLSPSAEEFRSLIADSRDITVETTPTSYVIHHTGRRGSRPALLRATLTLRRSDFRAVEQFVTVQSGNEVVDYRFVETGFGQYEAKAVRPEIFAVDAELVPSLTRSAVHDSSQPEPLHVPATIDFEIEVLDRLNSVDGLLGDELTVTRGLDALVVEGTVESVQRREQLLQSLGSAGSHPSIKIEISTVEALEAKTTTLPSKITSFQAIEVERAMNPIHSDLRRELSKRFTGRELETEVGRISNRILDAAVTARLHAKVIRQLTVRFSGVELEQTEAKRKWLALINSHAQQLQQDLKLLRHELKQIPPVVTVGASDERVASDATLDFATAQVFELTTKVEDAVRRSFATSTENASVVAVKSSTFWQSMRSADHWVDQVISKTN